MKTIIVHLLVVSLPIFIVCMSLTFWINGLSFNISEMDSFTSEIAYYFAHSFAMHSILTTLNFAFEFLVYPLAKNKLPNILKRITAVPLIFTLVSLVCFFLKLASYSSYSSETTPSWIVNVLHTVMSGILLQVLLSAVFELKCVQLPYHMRGLLVSFVVPLTVASCVVTIEVGMVLKHSVCSTPVHCWHKSWFGSKTQCLFYTYAVLSHLILSENDNIFHWISPVLCCGSLVQDESER